MAEEQQVCLLFQKSLKRDVTLVGYLSVTQYYHYYKKVSLRYSLVVLKRRYLLQVPAALNEMHFFFIRKLSLIVVTMTPSLKHNTIFTMFS